MSEAVEARAELARRLMEVDAADEAVRPAEEAVRLAAVSGVDPGLAALAEVTLARSLAGGSSTRARHARVPRAPWSRPGRPRTPGLEVEALTTVAFLDEIDGARDAAADRLGTACAWPGPRASRSRSCARTTRSRRCTTTTGTSRPRCRCCGPR